MHRYRQERKRGQPHGSPRVDTSIVSLSITSNRHRQSRVDPIARLALDSIRFASFYESVRFQLEVSLESRFFEPR